MAWGCLSHKIWKLEDDHEEMVANSSSLYRKTLPEFFPQHSPSLLSQNRADTLILSQVLYLSLAMEKKAVFKILKHKLISKSWGGGGISMQLPLWPGLNSSHVWNSALVPWKESQWPYVALPPRFLIFTGQITQRIWVMYSIWRTILEPPHPPPTQYQVHD